MSALVNLLYLAVTIYAWLIVIRSLLSWFRLRPGTAAYRIHEALFRVTEPYLALFRRFIPLGRIGGAGIDLSPFVGLLVLFVVMRVLARL
jgi:YggT family protein